MRDALLAVRQETSKEYEFSAFFGLPVELELLALLTEDAILLDDGLEEIPLNLEVLVVMLVKGEILQGCQGVTTSLMTPSSPTTPSRSNSYERATTSLSHLPSMSSSTRSSASNGTPEKADALR